MASSGIPCSCRNSLVALIAPPYRRKTIAYSSSSSIGTSTLHRQQYNIRMASVPSRRAIHSAASRRQQFIGQWSKSTLGNRQRLMLAAAERRTMVARGEGFAKPLESGCERNAARASKRPSRRLGRPTQTGYRPVPGVSPLATLVRRSAATINAAIILLVA